MDQENQGLTVQEVLGSLLGGLGAGYLGHRIGKGLPKTALTKEAKKVGLVEEKDFPSRFEGLMKWAKAEGKESYKPKGNKLGLFLAEKGTALPPKLLAGLGGSIGALGGYRAEAQSKDQSETLAGLLGLAGGAAVGRKLLDPVPGALKQAKKEYTQLTGEALLPVHEKELVEYLNEKYAYTKNTNAVLGGFLGVPVGTGANYYLNPFYEKPEKKKKNGV